MPYSTSVVYMSILHFYSLMMLTAFRWLIWTLFAVFAIRPTSVLLLVILLMLQELWPAFKVRFPYCGLLSILYPCIICFHVLCESHLRDYCATQTLINLI